MSKRRLGFVLGAGALAFVAGDVTAADTDAPVSAAEAFRATQFVVQPGYTAERQGQDSGTNEQGVIAHFVDPSGVQRLIHVGMTSDVPTSMAYGQCVATCYEGTADGWKATAENIQVSYNVGGERNCNHPQILAAPLVTNQTPNGVVSMVFGSDVDDPNNTTRTYVSAIDPVTCSLVDLPNNVVDQVQISTSDDNDTGGSAKNVIAERVFSATDDTDLVEFTGIATAFENGGGGFIWALGFRMERDATTGDLVVSRRFSDRVYNNVNIARQGLALLQDGYVAIGGPVGNNRPPSEGVYLYVYDWMNQNTVAEHLIQETNDLTDIWPNDVALEQGNFAGDLVWKHSVSNGNGEDTNYKGASNVVLHTLRVTDDYDLIIQDSLDEIDMPFQTHASICTGADGGVDTQDKSIAVIAGSPSGAGQGLMQIYNFGTETKMGFKRKEVISDYSDAGYQSNIYGGNPNNQGRNFFKCLGEVPNPGYGEEGGFRPYVKSFWAISMSGKEPSHERNSQFLVLAPATGDFDFDEFCEENPDDPACEPGEGEGEGEGELPTNEQAAGCACDVPGAQQKNGPAGAALLVMALGLAVAARRRREEV